MCTYNYRLITRLDLHSEDKCMIRVNYVNIRELASSNQRGYNFTRNLVRGLCVISKFAVQDTTLS